MTLYPDTDNMTNAELFYYRTVWDERADRAKDIDYDAYVRACAMVALYTEVIRQRGARLTTELVTDFWRQYGWGSRLYWKHHNRRWQWDSDVIARTSGMKFLTRDAILAVCTYPHEETMIEAKHP